MFLFDFKPLSYLSYVLSIGMHSSGRFSFLCLIALKVPLRPRRPSPSACPRECSCTTAVTLQRNNGLKLASLLSRVLPVFLPLSIPLLPISMTFPERGLCCSNFCSFRHRIALLKSRLRRYRVFRYAKRNKCEGEIVLT